MKKYGILALIAFLAMSLTVSAQDSNRANRMKDGNRGQREMKWTAKNRADNMAKQLNLNADQTAKLQVLFEKQHAERAAKVKTAREQNRQTVGDREAKREEMRKVREAAIAKNDAELEQIIGKEKLEQWKTYRADRMRQGRNGNSPRGNRK